MLNDFPSSPCAPGDKPEGEKGTGQWQVKLASKYIGLMMWLWARIVPLAFAPLGLLRHEEKNALLLKVMPVFLNNAAKLQSVAVDNGMARQVLQSQANVPTEPDYLAVCDGCHVILAGSGGTIEVCNSFARSAGWRVQKLNGGEYPYALHCPRCVGSVAMAGVPTLRCDTCGRLFAAVAGSGYVVSYALTGESLRENRCGGCVARLGTDGMLAKKPEVSCQI